MAASESPGTSGSEIPATTGDQIGVGAKTRRPRLYYLDGLRGLAAFYVLLFHATTVMTTGHSKLPLPLRIITVLANRGHFGVVVFIVLSGFSLMLPMAMAGDARLSGGFGNYVRRRARRILPPYYAALVFSIAILAGFNTFGRWLGLGSKVESTALSPGSVLSHVFLVHNLWFGLAFRINGPMWSVATEWQIYFILALALLPLIRRTNILVVVGAAWIITSLPQFFLPDAYNFYWAGPWLVGSFTLGMLGAVIGFSPAWRESAWRTRCPWGWLAVACMATVVVLVATGRADAWPGPVADLAVSLFAMCIINACWAPSARIVSAPPVSAPAVSAPPRPHRPCPQSPCPHRPGRHCPCRQPPSRHPPVGLPRCSDRVASSFSADLATASI